MYRCPGAPSADTIEAGKAKSKRRRRLKKRPPGWHRPGHPAAICGLRILGQSPSRAAPDQSAHKLLRTSIPRPKIAFQAFPRAQAFSATHFLSTIAKVRPHTLQHSGPELFRTKRVWRPVVLDRAAHRPRHPLEQTHAPRLRNRFSHPDWHRQSPIRRQSAASASQAGRPRRHPAKTPVPSTVKLYWRID